MCLIDPKNDIIMTLNTIITRKRSSTTSKFLLNAEQIYSTILFFFSSTVRLYNELSLHIRNSASNRKNIEQPVTSYVKYLSEFNIRKLNSFLCQENWHNVYTSDTGYLPGRVFSVFFRRFNDIIRQSIK